MTTVRTTQLKSRLGRADKTLSRISRNALNDTAKLLRAETPAHIEAAMDKPRPFTKKVTAVLYERASYDNLKASLRIAPIQARYLSPGEFGEESEHLIKPVRRDAFDRFGGIGAAYRRTEAKQAALLSRKHTLKSGRTISQFLIGRPRGQSQAGVWYRSKDLKSLKLVAAYFRRKQYKPQFGISEFWSRRGSELLDEQIEVQRNHPANKM